MNFFAIETVVTPVCYDDSSRLAAAAEIYAQKAQADAEKGQIKASEMRREVVGRCLELAAQIGGLAIEVPDEQQTPVNYLEMSWSERVLLHRSRVDHIKSLS